MNYNLEVVKKLMPVFGVVPIEYIRGLKKLIDSGKTGRSPEHESILISKGYEWNEIKKSYTYGTMDEVYTFPESPVAIWTYGKNLAKVLNGIPTFQNWIVGNDKYPNGKANEFIKVYSEMTGETDDGGGVGVADAPNRGIGGTEFKFAGTGMRPNKPEFKQPSDPTDALIFRLKKKAGFNKTLPSDEIIILGMRAKKENNQKLLDFLKTIKPLGENFVKKSDLSKLIQEIAKRIVTEIDVDEQSTTGAASPVTGPTALKKKKVMDEEQIDEMTTTSGGGGSSAGTTGYNIPGAFSRRGGSEKGIKGSEKLGYKLTPTGKKDMQRSADKLYESNDHYVSTSKLHNCKRDGHNMIHKKSEIKGGERIAAYKCSYCGKASNSSDPNQR